MDYGSVTSWAELELLVGRNLEQLEPPASPSSPRVFGLLFMRKGHPLVDKEIGPSLEYFSQRSGHDIDFIIPGWSRFAAGGSFGHQISYHFDEARFIESCDAVAKETIWTYSGGIDLLLFTAHSLAYGRALLDFTGVILLEVDKMREEKQIHGIDVLFERIFAAARNFKDGTALHHLSMQEARVSLVEGIGDAIVSHVAKDAKTRVNYARNFVVRDVTKKEASGLLNAVVKYL